MVSVYHVSERFLIVYASASGLIHQYPHDGQFHSVNIIPSAKSGSACVGVEHFGQFIDSSFMVLVYRVCECFRIFPFLNSPSMHKLSNLFYDVFPWHGSSHGDVDPDGDVSPGDSCDRQFGAGEVEVSDRVPELGRSGVVPLEVGDSVDDPHSTGFYQSQETARVCVKPQFRGHFRSGRKLCRTSYIVMTVVIVENDSR